MLRFLVPERFEGLNEQGLTNDQAIEALVRKYIQGYKHECPNTSSIADEDDRSATETLQIGGKMDTLYALSRLYFKHLDELVDSEAASRLKSEIAQGIGEENLFRDKESSPEEDQQKMIRNLLDYVEYTGEDDRVISVLATLKRDVYRKSTKYVLGDFGVPNPLLTEEAEKTVSEGSTRFLNAFRSLYPDQFTGNLELENDGLFFVGEIVSRTRVISQGMYPEYADNISQSVIFEILLSLDSILGSRTAWDQEFCAWICH
ncbi:MAG: hypothetical protein AAB473_01785 [Patescibacteria group bacterium]